MPRNKRRFYNKDGYYLYTVSRMTAREIAEQRKRQERTVQNWFKVKERVSYGEVAAADRPDTL